jgi:MSHA biogenesis protein MshQ
VTMKLKILRYRMLAFTLVCLFLLNIFVPLYHVKAGPGDWWNSNWLYRKKITIDYAKVGADLTSFPALVDISDSDLASKAQNDGDDIVFTDEYANKLDHEIEFYNNGAGRLIAWVEIPSLSSTVNTVLYMYYGNPGATNQQNVVSTWDASYVMVQHLKEATGLFYDSTSNDNDGTAYGTTSRNITGKLDGAVSFDANHDDYIDCGSKASLNFGTGSFAVSLWINANAQPADYYALLKKNRVSDGEWGFGIRSGPSTIGKDSLQFGVYDGTGASGSKIISSSAGILNNAWRYVVAERDGDTLRLFIDGVQVNSTTGAGAITVSTPDSFWIARHWTTQWYIGKMDEVRLSSSARSASWISLSRERSYRCVGFTVQAQVLFIGLSK